MCGIFGVVNPAAADLSSDMGRQCLGQLAHRGPDDEGWYESADVMLGHRRLTIMDLSSAGHEPMCNEDGTVWITFNGEIYRFWELRADLERLGHTFRSTCDAEVILHGYEEWGRSVLQRIDGMFAFGLWDAGSKALLLARDRLGKKPLFLTRRGTALAFASQVRPLVVSGIARPVVSPTALREYLFLNYVIGPKTIFRDVELLDAGSWLEWKEGKLSTGRYWDLADAVRASHDGDPQEKFERMLIRATSDRMVSDVPVGIFLSGGVDSAVIAALAQRESGKRLSTFSVGFDASTFDERPKAARVAARLGTEHHEVVCRPDDVPQILPRLTLSTDHLLADQSMIALGKLTEETRRSVKVVLTGDGGDELLAGYATYRALEIASFYTPLMPRALRRGAATMADWLPVSFEKMTPSMLATRFLKATTGSLSRAHASWRAIWSHTEIDDLLGGSGADTREWEAYATRFQQRSEWPLVKTAVYSDVVTWLVDSILAKVDRTTMAWGLEARSPLLDSRLMEFSFGTLLADGRANVGKKPLRRLAGSLFGSDLAGTKKEGFQVPFAAWFAGPLRDYVHAQLESVQMALPGVFDGTVIRRVETEHAARKRNHDLKLWSLVALAEWCRLYPRLEMAADDPNLTSMIESNP